MECLLLAAGTDYQAVKTATHGLTAGSGCRLAKADAACPPLQTVLAFCYVICPPSQLFNCTDTVLATRSTFVSYVQVQDITALQLARHACEYRQLCGVGSGGAPGSYSTSRPGSCQHPSFTHRHAAAALAQLGGSSSSGSYSCNPSSRNVWEFQQHSGRQQGGSSCCHLGKSSSVGCTNHRCSSGRRQHQWQQGSA